MSSNDDRVPEERLELYRKLIDTHPEVELKGGAKLPYTSLNGNMYTMLTKEGRVGLRLGKAEREAFITEHGTGLLASYGAVMKEYVEVPGALLEDTARLAPYLALSHAYAQSLKPKATRRKAK